MHAIQAIPFRPVIASEALSTGPTPNGAPPIAREWTDAWIGRMVGDRHRIVRHIASGGMGHVFLARHTSLGAFAAIKVLLETDDAVSRRCFRNEARIVSRLQHPNIVRVSDCGQLPDGCRYLVMELLAGVELGTWIAQHGAMRFERALAVLRQLASALDYMHGQGVLHRDIKPDNVILHSDANDAVRLFDFGVAKYYRTDHHSFDEGMVSGTPIYMSPEQANGQPCGPAADLYSFGALALELLTGEPPYERLPCEEVLNCVRTLPPLLPSAHGVHIPGFDEVMSKALARDPLKRFATAKQFVDALARTLPKTTTPPVRSAPAVDIDSLPHTVRTRARGRQSSLSITPSQWVAVAAWVSATAAWLIAS